MVKGPGIINPADAFNLGTHTEERPQRAGTTPEKKPTQTAKEPATRPATRGGTIRKATTGDTSAPKPLTATIDPKLHRKLRMLSIMEDIPMAAIVEALIRWGIGDGNFRIEDHMDYIERWKGKGGN